MTAGALTDNEYQAGRNVSRDTPLPYFGAGRFSSFINTPDNRLPTPRDLHHSYGDLVKVTYANDHIGLVLSTMYPSYNSANNQSWIQRATGTVGIINCSPRRLDEDESTASIPIAEANEVLGIPEDVPPFNDIAARIMWSRSRVPSVVGQVAKCSTCWNQCMQRSRWTWLCIARATNTLPSSR